MSDNKEKRSFFAAANSGVGFVSMFDGIFFGNSICRRYIIKGGPGTGKSSFMRRVGAFAESGGADVEYYYCSSDTSSLDGVVINGRVALLDGTAPHSYDTVSPGYCDSLIDLGRFWDGEKLLENAQSIRALGEQKREAYRRAYGYLGAALKARDAAKSLVFPCVMRDKMKAAVGRELARLGLSVKGDIKIRQTEAIGRFGEVYLPTLTHSATRVHYVEDVCGISAAYLGELLNLCRQGGFEAEVSYDTVDRECVREIFFPETSDCFTAVQYADEENTKINMKRFIQADKYSEVRRLYRATVQCCEQLKLLAVQSLSQAGDAHAEMEKYYVAAMDFPALEKYCGEFLDKLPLL